MIEPVRNHFSSVILSVFKSIKDFFFVFIAIVIKPDFRDVLIIGAIIILMIIYSIIKWYKTCFYIKENTLIYETGVLEKKILNLSMDKITTIDFSQNLINKLFGTYRLKIDSGSVKAGGAEIDIVLKKDIAVKTRNTLLGAANQEKLAEFGRRFCASTFDLLVTAITKNNLLLGLGLFFSMYTFLDDILKALDIKYMDTLGRVINPEKIFNASVLSLVLFIIELVVVIWIICIFLSIIGTIIKFHNFRVYEANNHIKIKYGLINTKSYSLPVENVQAVILKQNILKQKLGLYNIEISSVGYGNEAKEEAVLYPIANKKLVDELLGEFLPEFKIQPELQHVPENTLINFIMVPTLTGLILCSIATFFYSKAAILYLIIPFILGGCWLNYKNSALGFDEKMVISSSGGFNRKMHMVKMKSVQSLTISVNPFQRKKGTGNYQIQYYSSKVGDVINVKNILNSLFKEINTILLKE